MEENNASLTNENLKVSNTHFRQNTLQCLGFELQMHWSSVASALDSILQVKLHLMVATLHKKHTFSVCRKGLCFIPPRDTPLQQRNVEINCLYVGYVVVGQPEHVQVYKRKALFLISAPRGRCEVYSVALKLVFWERMQLLMKRGSHAWQKF